MIVENYEKVFTNDESNIIMKKKYNLLNKDYKNICQREGLCMKDIKLKEVMEELNVIEKIFFKRKFIKVYKKGITYGFNNK